MKKRIPARLSFFLAAFAAFSPFAARAETELSFADAARMAVEASEELRFEYASRTIREGVWRWGLRSYLPRFSVSASEDDRVSDIGQDSFIKNYSINVDQLLWDGGRLSLSRKMERADLDLAGSRLDRAAAEIAESGVSSYRDTLQTRSVLKIREKTLESLEEQRRILERETELGLARPSELREADIAVSLAKLETASLSLDLEEAEWNLAEKLGKEKLPPLSEKIDTQRSLKLPPLPVARSIAESRNLELAVMRYGITRRQAETRAASLSWVPSLRLTGSFGLSGRQYPLSRYSWSAGIAVDFSSPWLSGTFSANGGKDPPYDKNARLQQTLEPAPNPGAAFSRGAAELALALERSRYESARKEVRAAAEKGMQRCALLDKKRVLALEALELEREKFRLAELKLSLGGITRLDLMEAALDREKREVVAVEAAVAALRAERELERLLDLAPGELSALAERYGNSI